MAPKRKIPVCPLPCREEQFEDIVIFIRDNVEHEMSRCMYVSGVPGTGKTLIVNAAVTELKTHNPDVEFNHIYVNGLTLGSNPEKLWKKMWKELGGAKASAKQAHRRLSEYYQTQGIVPTVLVVDELDQFLDRRQAILYQLLEWSNDPVAKFIFIAIFNTTNLPENALTNRNASRFSPNRVVFPPYDHHQLRTIVETSLKKAKREKELNKDALTLLSMKVAAISGDARRALEIAKRASEILEASDKPGTRAVDEAFKELFSSPKIDTIRDCSTLEKNILQTVVSDLARTGTEETSFALIEREVIAASAYEGKNWSSDNIIGALSRLVNMKLMIMESSGNYFSAQTRLSLNVPTEDVKYALANQKGSH